MEDLVSLISETEDGEKVVALLRGTIKCKRLFKQKVVPIELRFTKDLLKLVLGQKGKIIKQVELGSIDEIRRGQATTNFLKYGKKFSVDVCFSIVYSRTRTLDIIMGSHDAQSQWIKALKVLMSNARNLGSEAHAARRAYNTMAPGAKKGGAGGGTIKQHDVHDLLFKLNVQAKTATIKRKMKALGSDQLDFPDFLRFMRTLRKRKELEWLFLRFAEGGESTQDPLMTPNDLAKFLLQEQGEGDADVAAIFEAVTPGRSTWNEIDFEEYCCSDHNSLFDPEKLKLYQDMSQPLQHYFVSSSHNTCLEGDQLNSKSTTEQFAHILRAGARCIEFDVWEGANGEPTVTHGNTLCTKVPLHNVISTVNNVCFADGVSSFPLIISVENHLGLAQQKKMAKYLLDFGEKILPNPRGKDVVYSPEQLKGRVLLKGYPATLGADEDDTNADDTPDLELPLISDERSTPFHDTALAQAVKEDSDDLVDQVQGDAPSGDLSHVMGGVQNTTHTPVSISAEKEKEKKGSKVKKPKVDKNYSSLLYWDTFNSYKDLMPIFHDKLNYHMASYVEWKVEKLMSNYSLAANIAFTARFMVRTYPKGTRVDSSNPNPIPCWELGMQIVTLNWQTTNTLPIMLNYGKFLENGACGYVLKPEYQRRSIKGKQMTPEILEAFQGDRPGIPFTKLDIKIFGARQLPKVKKATTVDTFVEVVMSDIDGHRRFRTPVVKDNGFNPNFNSEYKFALNHWENCYLTFIVTDQVTKEDLGFYSLPISCARPGYRVVRLVNSNLKPSNFGAASLFVSLHFG